MRRAPQGSCIAMNVQTTIPVVAAARTSPVSSVVLSGAVRLIESVLVVLTGILIYFLNFGVDAGANLPAYSLVIVAAAQVHVAAFGGAHLYDVPALRRPWHKLGRDRKST